MGAFICGPTGTRTPNPLIANEVLYQLSHRPLIKYERWVCLDSNQGPRHYQ